MPSPRVDTVRRRTGPVDETTLKTPLKQTSDSESTRPSNSTPNLLSEGNGAAAGDAKPVYINPALRLRQSALPIEWRPAILSSYFYALSCFFYLIPWIFWRNPAELRVRQPCLAHLAFAFPTSLNGVGQIAERIVFSLVGCAQNLDPYHVYPGPASDILYVDFATLLPWYWPVQVFLAFFSDYVTICIPSWSHLIDVFTACWGNFIICFVAFAEYLCPAKRFGWLALIVTAYFAFVMSRKRRRQANPDVDSYIRWHTLWHTVGPFWLSLLGWYTMWHAPVREQKPEETYPNLVLSCVLPLIMAVTVVWVTSPSKGLKLTER